MTDVDAVLGNYRLLKQIGHGGMGEVYLAHDLTLDRKVAVKVLPTPLERDATAQERLLREAQSAAALDHPFVCKIFEVGEAEGRTFVAMEYIAGGTLADRIERGPIPVREAVQLAIEIAEALEIAESNGIVHRDLKPSNLMITTGGHVKVMDFGLAKPFRVGAEATTRGALTLPGQLAGTVAYMSPEQLRGEQVDSRSDIFSFGLVLYEMLTGVHPFRLESQYATAAAILTEPARALRHHGKDLPALLEPVLDSMLAKNRAERYPSMRELTGSLTQVRDQLARGWHPDRPDASPSESVRRRARAAVRARTPVGQRWIWAAALAGAGVVMLAVFLLFDRRPGPGLEAPLWRLANPVQVTSAVGVEESPAWSPDGRTLAYQSNQAGNWDVWVTPLGASQPLNRTADHAGADIFPAWSPDGSQIAFWSDRDGGGIFVMSALAGSARKLVTAGEPFGSPAWVSNEEIANTVVANGQAYLEFISLRDGRTRRVALPRQGLRRHYNLSLSPDARFATYIATAAPESTAQPLIVFRIADGKAIAITDGLSNVRSPSWSRDGRCLYYVANAIGSMDLWQQCLDADGTPLGQPQALTTGIGIRNAAFSPGGTKLAYSKGQRIANLWRLPITPDRPATWQDAGQMTTDQAFVEFLSVSRDGRQLALCSDRSGNQDIWTIPTAGGELRQLTTERAPDWSPRWSPDGREIAFYSVRSGNRDLWIMPTSGGLPRSLTTDEAEDILFDWSPDGRDLAFLSTRGGNGILSIWTVPAAGGQPVRLTEHQAIDASPQYSPDGQWIAFDSMRTGDWRIWRMRRSGDAPEQLSAGPGVNPVWSPDGKTIYFIGVAERAGNLWSLSLDTRRERPVTRLRDRRGNLGRTALATDGHYLFFTWEEDLGDLWVIDAAPLDASSPRESGTRK